MNAVIGQYFAEVTAAAPVVEVTVPPSLPAMAMATSRQHLTLNGKSLRRTRCTGRDPKAMMHMVGLYNMTAGYMWQQQTVPGKGKERQAALELIAPLNL